MTFFHFVFSTHSLFKECVSVLLVDLGQKRGVDPSARPSTLNQDVLFFLPVTTLISADHKHEICLCTASTFREIHLCILYTF